MDQNADAAPTGSRTGCRRDGSVQVETDDLADRVSHVRGGCASLAVAGGEEDMLALRVEGDDATDVASGGRAVSGARGRRVRTGRASGCRRGRAGPGPGRGRWCLRCRASCRQAAGVGAEARRRLSRSLRRGRRERSVPGCPGRPVRRRPSGQALGPRRRPRHRCGEAGCGYAPWRFPPLAIARSDSSQRRTAAPGSAAYQATPRMAPAISGVPGASSGASLQPAR